MIVAKTKELRLISLDTLDHTAIVLPIRNLQQVVVIEYDPVERFVYWTDQTLHLIKRAKLDGSGRLFEYFKKACVTCICSWMQTRCNYAFQQ